MSYIDNLLNSKDRELWLLGMVHMLEANPTGYSFNGIIYNPKDEEEHQWFLQKYRDELERLQLIRKLGGVQ